MYVIEFMNGGIRGKNIHSFLWGFFGMRKKISNYKVFKKKAKKKFKKEPDPSNI